MAFMFGFVVGVIFIIVVEVAVLMSTDVDLFPV